MHVIDFGTPSSVSNDRQRCGGSARGVSRPLEPLGWANFAEAFVHRRLIFAPFAPSLGHRPHVVARAVCQRQKEGRPSCSLLRLQEAGMVWTQGSDTRM